MASYDLKAILGEKLKRLTEKTLKALVDCMCTVGASLCSLDKRVSALESVEIPEGGYKPMQEPLASPSASGTAIQFIDSVSQDATGRMTATKKTVRTGSTSQTGVVQLEDSHSSTSTTKAATPNSVKEAYDLANTANTGLANKQDKPSSATENNIATFNGTKSTKDSGKAFLPSTSTWDGTSDDKVPTAKAVQAQLDNKGDAKDNHNLAYGYCRCWPYSSSWGKNYALLARMTSVTNTNWAFGQLFKIESRDSFAIFKVSMSGTTSAVNEKKIDVLYSFGLTKSQIEKLIVARYTYTGGTSNGAVVSIYTDVSLNLGSVYNRVSLRQLDNHSGSQYSYEDWQKATFYTHYLEGSASAASDEYLYASLSGNSFDMTYSMPVHVYIDKSSALFDNVWNLCAAGKVPVFLEDDRVYTMQHFWSSTQSNLRHIEFVFERQLNNSLAVLSYDFKKNDSTSVVQWEQTFKTYYPGEHTNYTDGDAINAVRTHAEVKYDITATPQFTNFAIYRDYDGSLLNSVTSFSGSFNEAMKRSLSGGAEAVLTNELTMLIFSSGTYDFTLDDLIANNFRGRKFRITFVNMLTDLDVNIVFCKSVSSGSYSRNFKAYSPYGVSTRNYYSITVAAGYSITVDVMVSKVMDDILGYGMNVSLNFIRE